MTIKKDYPPEVYGLQYLLEVITGKKITFVEMPNVPPSSGKKSWKPRSIRSVGMPKKENKIRK